MHFIILSDYANCVHFFFLLEDSVVSVPKYKKKNRT